MARLYIDTNIFIGFYQGVTDPVERIDEILPFTRHLIVPEQSALEFRRNRLVVLNNSINQFQKSVSFTPHCTSFIKHQVEFSELGNCLGAAKKAAKKVIKKLEEARDVSADPVAVKIEALFSSPDTLFIRTTDDLITAAHRRKLLGKPPCSKDKITIGDELIWESILTKSTEDLVIVTSDRGFLDYEEVLAREYEHRTNAKLLTITDKISEAITALGQTPPKGLTARELEEDLWTTSIPELTVECPKCEGKEMYFDEVAIADGRVFKYLLCPECGHYLRV